MSASGPTLESYYETDFKLHYFMKYTRDDIENMYPFERDILIGLYVKQKEHEDKSTPTPSI